MTNVLVDPNSSADIALNPLMPPAMLIGFAIIAACAGLVIIAAVTNVARWVRTLAGVAGSAGLTAYLIVSIANIPNFA